MLTLFGILITLLIGLSQLPRFINFNPVLLDLVVVLPILPEDV